MTANLLAVATVVSDGALLDLALDAFADGGYEGTSVRELCRRLGVSHNLVHERYGSKELLWYAAIDHDWGVATVEMTLGAVLAAVASDVPHVLLSDIGMPGRDGYEFIRELRARGVQVPAVALTAYARSEDRTKALSSGYQSHIAKPVEAAELLATVAALQRWPARSPT